MANTGNMKKTDGERYGAVFWKSKNMKSTNQRTWKHMNTVWRPPSRSLGSGLEIIQNYLKIRNNFKVQNMTTYDNNMANNMAPYFQNV